MPETTPSNASFDCTTIWSVTRDICYFYHLQTEWKAIQSDTEFDYEAQPYWEYLDIVDSNFTLYEKEFVRDGCLVIVFSMCLEVIEGAGNHLKLNALDECFLAVTKLNTPDEKTQFMKATLLEMLSRIRENDYTRESFSKEAVWVNKQYVYSYFQDKLRECIQAEEFKSA